MSKIYLIIVIFFVASATASEDIKIKDVCKWYHEEILGWHQSYLLFKKRHLEVSDMSKYPDTNDKTIERYLVKQKKLLDAIDNAEKKLQSLSKVYHYLECTRFEKKFCKDNSANTDIWLNSTRFMIMVNNDQNVANKILY